MGRERSWLVPFAVLAGLEWLWAYSLARLTGYPGEPNFVRQLALAAIMACFMFAGFLIWRFFGLARSLKPHPTREIARAIGKNLPRFAILAIGLALIAVHMASFNWSKSILPTAVPFWADRPLANFDEALFGTAAWRWTLQWIGPASEVFRRAYGLWLPIHLIALAALVCTKPSDRKTLLILTYILTWMVGTIMSYLVSSAGPLFYGPLGFGDRFQDLIGQPHLNGIPKTAAYLWNNYTQHAAVTGGGISAFPSLHVAMALWVAAVVRFHWSSLIFFTLIFVGSFLLGWHYFLDAPGGVACFLVAYAIAGQYVAWANSREVSKQAAAAMAPSHLVGGAGERIG
jgi:hypothetical protein